MAGGPMFLPAVPCGQGSLTRNVSRRRLWFAGAGLACLAVGAGWIVVDTGSGDSVANPPAVVQSVSGVIFMVVLLLLALGASLPIQLVMLAILTFTVIGSPRTPRAAGG